MNAAQALRRKSVNWRILADTFTVGSFTSLVKVAGAVKVLVMARMFGTSDVLDAFLIAFVLPSFLAEVVAGALSPSLMPIFIEVRERRGPEAAAQIYESVLSASLLVLALLACLLALAGGVVIPLLGSGFDAQKLT